MEMTNHGRLLWSMRREVAEVLGCRAADVAVTLEELGVCSRSGTNTVQWTIHGVWAAYLSNSVYANEYVCKRTGARRVSWVERGALRVRPGRESEFLAMLRRVNRAIVRA
ncbi:hypothetical protein [Saccharopolyspora shandongensis]|uniref:hypothetical protein n=1 Tax=Saccharopolyspora shandongensis TaxID=418495 RepID=UPI0033E58609